MICDWFVVNKLSIHFGEDKTKSILFKSKILSKSKVKKASPLNIQYKGKKVKRHKKVTYLGCIFDETLSGESMATHVINKFKIKISLSTKNFLDIPLHRESGHMSWNSWKSWKSPGFFFNLEKSLKSIQISQFSRKLSAIPGKFRIPL